MATTILATRASIRPALEGLGLLAVTLPLALGLRVPTLWVLVPVLWIVATHRASEPYGLSLHNPGSASLHLAMCSGVFLPYLLGHYIFGTSWQGHNFELRWPPELPHLILDQVLIVGLPEEMFFRGYLQTQFDKSLGKPYRVLGAKIGWGMPLAAALFAVCHIFHGGPPRLIVFFPGLWYGWLRARTETIAVPALYHAASNVLMQIMLASLSA